jgi:hypothetical protein
MRRSPLPQPSGLDVAFESDFPAVIKQSHPPTHSSGSLPSFNYRESTMQKLEKIDYARLLGFDAVGNEISGTIDFQDETFSAKLGAKVGGPEATGTVKRTEDAVN